jgi:hypothetical protein
MPRDWNDLQAQGIGAKIEEAREGFRRITRNIRLYVDDPQKIRSTFVRLRAVDRELFHAQQLIEKGQIESARESVGNALDRLTNP